MEIERKSMLSEQYETAELEKFVEKMGKSALDEVEKIVIQNECERNNDKGPSREEDESERNEYEEEKCVILSREEEEIERVMVVHKTRVENENEMNSDSRSNKVTKVVRDSGDKEIEKDRIVDVEEKNV